MLAAAVAQDVGGEAAGLVAPALAYGYKSQPKCGGGQHFPGTTSLDAQTLAHTVRDCIREFARHGVEKLVIVNGHYENQWFLIEAIDLAMRELGGKGQPLTIMRMEYWTSSRPATLAKVFPDGFPGYALEHAAVIETSMMLHYHPQLVRLGAHPVRSAGRFPPYDIYPTRTVGASLRRALLAKAATPEKGKAMAAEVSALNSRARRKELAVIERTWASMPAIAPVKTALLVMICSATSWQPDGYAAKAGLDIAPLRAAIGPVSAVLAGRPRGGTIGSSTPARATYRTSRLPSYKLERSRRAGAEIGSEGSSRAPARARRIRSRFSWTSCARWPTKS